MARSGWTASGDLFQDLWGARELRSRERALAHAIRLRCRLGPTSARLLFLVAASGPQGIGVVQLASALGLSTSGASRAAAPLVRRGLVERCASAADRRLRPLTLSADGAQLVRALVLTPPSVLASGPGQSGTERMGGEGRAQLSAGSPLG